MNPGVVWTFPGATPLWLAALAAVALVALASGWLSGRPLPAGRRAVLLGVRLLALLLLAAAVLRPAREVDLVRPRRDPLVFLLDDSRSMAGSAAAVRAELARWQRQSDAASGGLGELYRLEFLGLGAAPAALDPRTQPAFERATTPLGATLEALAETRDGSAGVVLLSDGQDTERPGEPPPALPFPVYPLVPAAAAAPDLWIAGVDTPPVAFIRTPAEVRVHLKARGLAEGPVDITLLADGRPLRTETAQVGATGGEVALSLTPQRTGRKAYRVEVTPRPGEASLENNRAQFTLDVIRDKTRVLLVAGTPTWDVRFLRRRLRQDPGVDLITFLILRTPQDLSTIPQDELSLIPFPTQELFSQELPSFDAVIFANFDYGPYVPRHYLDNLVRFVRESGGGFAMLGGDRSFALGGYVGSPLEEILPLDLSGAAPGRALVPGGFRPRLTESGSAHPLFQWRGDPEENRALWNDLPELENSNWVLKARPGAVVLAENPEQRNEFGPMPTVALGEFGQGRTLMVATDSLWHWALPQAAAGGDDNLYRDFWTRALRWLVHDPEMELVRLGALPEPLRSGSEVVLRARVLDRFYEPARGAQIEGTVTREDGEGTALRWIEEAPGAYRTQPFPVAGTGLWRVAVEARQGGVFLGRDAAEFPVEPESPEGLRPGVNREYLEELARASGGRVFPAGDSALLEQLAAQGQARLEVVGRRVEEVWATPLLLWLSVAAASLDWALRRLWE